MRRMCVGVTGLASRHTILGASSYGDMGWYCAYNAPYVFIAVCIPSPREARVGVRIRLFLYELRFVVRGMVLVGSLPYEAPSARAHVGVRTRRCGQGCAFALRGVVLVFIADCVPISAFWWQAYVVWCLRVHCRAGKYALVGRYGDVGADCALME